MAGTGGCAVCSGGAAAISAYFRSGTAFGAVIAAGADVVGEGHFSFVIMPKLSVAREWAPFACQIYRRFLCSAGLE